MRVSNSYVGVAADVKRLREINLAVRAESRQRGVVRRRHAVNGQKAQYQWFSVNRITGTHLA